MQVGIGESENLERELVKLFLAASRIWDLRRPYFITTNHSNGYQTEIFKGFLSQLAGPETDSIEPYMIFYYLEKGTK